MLVGIRFADSDDIIAGATVDGRRTGSGPDFDLVITDTTVDARGATVRPFDDEVIVTRAECDFECLDFVEHDPGRQPRRADPGSEGPAVVHAEAD